MADEKKKKNSDKSQTIDLVSNVNKPVDGADTPVKILNKHPIDGKYIVKSKGGRFFLLPTDKLNYSFVEQTVVIPAIVETPYEFDSELSELGVEKKDAQEALYRGGHVKKGLTKDQIIQALLVRGISQIKKDGKI